VHRGSSPRSSGALKSNMSDPKFSRRPALARLALFALALAFTATGDARSQTSASSGSESAVEAVEDAPAPFAIRTMRDGTEAEFFGEIVPGSAEAFIDTARQLPHLRVVHLTSNGGSVGEAERLFRYFRHRRLATYVSGSCFSACALAFAGGRERWIGRFGQLGYHSPSGSAEEVEAGKKVIGAAMRWGWSATGSDFVKRALATPHGELWLPTTPELVAAGVVTAVSDGTHFALSGIAPTMTPMVLAEAMSAQEPAIAALNEKHPDEAVAIFASLQRLYDSGGTEAEFTAAFFQHALQIVEKDVPLADDDVIVDMVRVGAEQAVSLRAAHPSLCASYFRGEDTQDVSAAIPADQVTRGLAVVERVLRTARPRPFDRQRAERAAAMVIEEVKRRIPEGAFVLVPAATRTARDDRAFCDANIEVLGIVLDLGDAEAAAFMRAAGQPADAPPADGPDVDPDAGTTAAR
jgi:hypothetical protein